MKKWIPGLAILGLLIAHQDYWQWERRDLVFGFIPWNMAWHMGLTVVTALVWILVCRYCWPSGLTRESTDQTGGRQNHS